MPTRFLRGFACFDEIATKRRKRQRGNCLKGRSTFGHEIIKSKTCCY